MVIQETERLPDAKPRGLCTAAAVLVLACGTVGVTAAEITPEAHEHGMAEIELAVEGSDVQVNFASPVYNLVGFEHAPRDEEDREAVAVALALLGDPANLVLLHADAACTAVDIDVHWEAAFTEEDEGHHDEEDGGEHGEQHADATVAVRYTCDHPDRLDSLDITAFESFERMSEVELRAVGPGGAVAESPERDSPRVDLSGLFER
ncbi:MAG: DUF2796 domain-containing protein [Gammaproteobacteria bacterium]|nr:DUF2796 domain-containing protein [Gammaproteobacteria bacterium]